MSILIVLKQMVIIFLLIITGAVLYRKSLLTDQTSKQISGIIVNICNPALLICSAFESGEKISNGELLTAGFIVLLSYAILLLASFLVPALLRVPRQQHYAYRLLTVYGNVSFIGIPLISAVLGNGSLIFISINNLVFNIMIYTHGISVIKKAVAVQNGSEITDKKKTEPFFSRLLSTGKSFINAGTVSAILTIVFYVSNIRIPSLITETLGYIGRSTTFLSMLVLGVAVAQVSLKNIFSNGRMYLFVLLRMVLLPTACIFLFRLFIQHELILSTTALLLAVPAANMPLILSQQHEVDSSTISEGIILSTILSLATIPFVTFLIG